MRSFRRIRFAVAAIAIATVAAACGGSGDEGLAARGGADVSEDRANQAALTDEQAARPAPAAGRAGYSAQTSGGGSAAVASEETGPRGSSVPGIGPSVIKTADLGLDVPRADFQDAVDEAVSTAGRYGGYVVSTSLDKEGARRARLVIRVPSDRFEQTLADLKDLGGIDVEVDRETVSGQDVTQEFVDLEARLRNLSAQEAVLLRLMDEAQTVTDTIRVQRELQPVQLEIERLRGRLRYLEDQTSLATITTTLSPLGAAAPKDPGPLQRAWENALDTSMAVISAVIVGAGFVIPVGLLLGIAFLVVRRFGPRVTA